MSKPLPTEPVLIQLVESPVICKPYYEPMEYWEYDRRRLRSLALAAVLLFAVAACGEKPTFTTAGTADKINVLRDPFQEPCSSTETFSRRITGGSVKIIPVATYRIAGEVMSKRKYTQGWGAEIAPFDLALVWGMLTYPHVRKQLSIKHDNTRMAWFRMKGDEPPVDHDYAMSHGANNHLIPASENIRMALDGQVKVNDKIALSGYLVDVEGRNHEREIVMKTSLIRTDTDRGACEIIYVTRLQVGDKIYR